MITTERTITICGDKSKIDEPIFLYRGDFEVEVKFKIFNSKYKFQNGLNLIAVENAAYGQLAILGPNGGNVFSDVTKCLDGTVSFVITETMIDELKEVGKYSFQIRLFDASKTSRVTIPPVEFGLIVGEPVASEDTTELVDEALVGYSIARATNVNEPPVGPAFDGDQYNKTYWETGDRITAGKLNKIENAISALKDNDLNLQSQANSNFNVISAILDDKANLSEVRLKKVPNTLNDCDEEMLQAIQGGESTNFSILSIPRDGSVDYKKTNFITTGKNKFSMDNITPGYYVNYANGNLYANLDNKVSDFIPLEPNIEYTLSSQVSGDLSQMAFYDSNRNYVSGLPNSGKKEYITFITEPNVYYMRLSIPTTVTTGIQLEYGDEMTAFEEYGLYIDKLIISESNIPNSETFVRTSLGKNKFSMDNITPGYYVNYANGNLYANLDNKVSDFIPLEPNIEYTLSSQVSGDLSQMAFYDSNRNYVSGLPNSGKKEYITFITEPNVYYMRLSIPTTVTTGIQLEYGDEMTAFEEYGLYIDKTLIPKTKNDNTNIITVMSNGNGDFLNLREALDSIKYASANNKYIIEISEGTYTVFDDFTIDELNNSSFIGLIIPDHVSIRGVGNRDDIIIYGSLPSGVDVITQRAHEKISTLCLMGNVNLENITVVGENMRYAIHDDYNYPDSVKNIKNCAFIRKKGDGRNYGGKQAWGEGSWSGQRFYFEDCDFITEFNYFAYTSHNNYNFNRPSYHKFINCSFYTTTGGSFRFETLGSGHTERVDVIGCRMNGHILLSCYADNTDKIVDHRLYGYGNDVVPVIIQGQDKEYTYEFVGETRRYHNATGKTITKGTPVMINSTHTSIVVNSGNDISRFIGVAVEDIDNMGIVQIGGYLPISKTRLENLNIGDKIGIINGELTVVTDGEYIGIVTINDFIKLK